MPAKHAKVEEARSVLPRGLVIQQNITKLGSITTHSIAAQTVDPASDESSRVGLAGDRGNQIHSHLNVGCVADERSLQQWRSIQRKYWLELQRLQHSIQQTLEQSRDPGWKAGARSPTAVLERLLDLIRSSISQDMHALNRSCCVEMASSSALSAARRGSCAFASRADADAAVLTDAGAAVHAEEEAQNTAEEEEV